MKEPADPSKDEEDEPHSQRVFVNLIAAIVCLVILIVGYWLINKLWESKKLQDCVFSGRRNCAPIEVTR